MESQDGRSDEPDDDGMNSVVSTLEGDLLLEEARAVPASMDAFLAQVERRAFRMAELNLGHREDALDAVQDAMLRLVKHYSDKPAQEWTPLFWGILRRRIVDLQRRRKVRSIMVGWLGGRDDDGDELPAWEPADTSPGPLERLTDSQSYADMAAAVKLLPQRQREAFMLRVLEGLDVAETAQAMGCSEGSVKTHLSRALQRLRDQLEEWR
ncbi:RNA polymerase sigma-70 factor, ECF subfamily [Dyella jiangningensis]|nr:RNA polymerase sigma-70 factor (ECF subfamily) [Dyella sp. AtDHG13]SDJ83440.1 RNA polymerase sigma-70 factor, ECF subfamily [Dyella jiangningensis]